MYKTCILNQGLNKWRQTVCVDWQAQYSKDIIPSQTDLWTQCNSYQTPNNIFYKFRQVDLKIEMERQRNWNTENGIEKKNKVERIALPDFKTLNIAIVIKTVW